MTYARVMTAHLLGERAVLRADSPNDAIRVFEEKIRQHFARELHTQLVGWFGPARTNAALANTADERREITTARQALEARPHQ